MTRVFPFVAAAAIAALHAFGGADAFAAAVGGDGPGHPAGGPNGGATGGPGGAPRLVAGCDFRADQMGLDGPARRCFLRRRQQGGAF
jgi:hypothetical protein